MKGIPEAFEHILAAWNERDLDRIGERASRCLAERVVFADPTNFIKGRDAFIEMIKAFRKAYPDATCYRTSGLDSHNNRYRYSWKILSGDNLIVAGTDFVELDSDGMILSVVGFFGELPPIK